MNNPTLDESKRLEETATRLFSGFVKKLTAMRLEAMELYQKTQNQREAGASGGKSARHNSDDTRKLVQHYFAIVTRFRSLEPHLTKLARQISQRLDHTEIDEIIRIELEARLADFENEIHTTREYLTNYTPSA